MIDLHNVWISGMSGFVWLSLVNAFISRGIVVGTQHCWVAAGVCALLLSGRIVTHGSDLLRSSQLLGRSYIYKNVAFACLVSVAIGFSAPYLIHFWAE
jgi:hypothetical protein